ncbi:MAG TPA: BamA/TamA family outer membrane protein [Planctomycetota bacterium]|nr:BamA/TamA family outer membrane protein [Planctomycetota bacterium]
MRRGAAILWAALAACAGDRPPPAQEDPRFVFRGAREMSEDALRELVARELEDYLRDPREAILDDAAFRMVQTYGLLGYADATVAFEEQGNRVLFIIEEGRRWSLGRVHFAGRRQVDEDVLESVVPEALPGRRVPYSGRLVSRMQAGLRAIYRARGFVEADVEVESEDREPDAGRVNVTFRIHEGEPYVVGEVRLPEGLPGEAAAAARTLAEGPYAPTTPDRLATLLETALREDGRPFARAEVKAVPDPATKRVALVAAVDPGPSATLGKLELESELRTRQGYIQNRSGLVYETEGAEGERYRASRLRQAEERLLGTGLFRTARLEPGAVEEGRVTVRGIFEETEPGEAAVRAGYGTLEGERIGVDLSYHNLFGGAEYGRIGATLARYGYRGDAQFTLRHFAGSDVHPGVLGFYEVRDFPSFEAVYFGGEVSVRYDFSRRVEAAVGLQHADIRTTDVEEGVPPGDLLDFAYTAVFVSASVDLRDSRFLPRDGFFATARAEWSDEILLESELPFVRVQARAAYHVPLPWGLVAAIGIQGGVIAPQDETQVIPISLRYFAGGFTTVRGFEFASIGPHIDGDPTGGEAYAAGQSELRFPVWGDLHGAVFADRGGVWFDRNDIDVEESRYGTGLGVRYYTPAAAVVLDVGFNPDRKGDEDLVQVHVSIGFPF